MGVRAALGLLERRLRAAERALILAFPSSVRAAWGVFGRPEASIALVWGGLERRVENLLAYFQTLAFIGELDNKSSL